LEEVAPNLTSLLYSREKTTIVSAIVFYRPAYSAGPCIYLDSFVQEILEEGTAVLGSKFALKQWENVSTRHIP
jgi:hypothetical protein